MKKEIKKSINLALSSDAKVTGNAVNGRGNPIDILWNTETNAYEKKEDYNEYGLGYGDELSETLFWQVEWGSEKEINYITLGGSYSNQTQATTNWVIKYKNNDSWVTLGEGTGGWIDGGIYVYEGEIIKTDALRVELSGDSKSTHLRARGGVSNREDDSKQETKATLIQLITNEETPPKVSPIEEQLKIITEATSEIERLSKLPMNCKDCEECEDCNDNGGGDTGGGDNGGGDNGGGTVIPPDENKGLAFIGAKGAGANATGGRGGKVIHITTLDWNATGGLKEAIQTKGKRIIVFNVSGEIDATSQGDWSTIIQGSDYDNITIAGQTAPHGGITIKTNEFRFGKVSNVIFRYIRFRGTSWTRDTLAFWGGENIIFDHCTFGNGGDESASWSDSSDFMSKVTIQNCFFQDSKTGCILGVDNQEGDFTFTNNVFTTTSHRFPNPKGNGRYDLINNIVYNWKYRLSVISGSGEHNVINNYYKGSKNGINGGSWFTDYNLTPKYLNNIQINNGKEPRVYASGSLIYKQRETPKDDDKDMFSIFASSGYTDASPPPNRVFKSEQYPLVGESFDIMTAKESYKELVENGNVGANATLNADGSINYYHDDRDKEALEEIINDSYSGGFYSYERYYPVIPKNVRPSNYDTNGDGIPDEYAKLRGFDPLTDLTTHVWDSGNVGVEEFLSQIDVK